ncbi:hypothetical protein T4E_3197 [Trichinella pseudospiralis]|uniref:Uncharacterized protein n=1 Tax=Trichinella pseudospiralis TaxID=6337 RepID=A0A0V0Y6X5_TRIPS|nr:hypothetical protein T4E_3197 [Trichinella pseudospiralis]
MITFVIEEQVERERIDKQRTNMRDWHEVKNCDAGKDDHPVRESLITKQKSIVDKIEMCAAIVNIILED